MSTRVAGTFEVTLTPQVSSEAPDLPSVGRMTIAKRYQGGLDATALGEMLTAGTAIKTSGVYVAVERVSGSVDGKRGAFALHHTGIMTRGAPSLNITVVPDSGTGELEGITGTLNINIVDGKHFYEFEYSLPER